MGKDSGGVHSDPRGRSTASRNENPTPRTGVKVVSYELQAAAVRLATVDLAYYQGPSELDADMRAGIMLARGYLEQYPLDDGKPWAILLAEPEAAK